MGVVGLLSYYDTPPSWLRATIRSCLKVGMKKLVAVDGAYKTFPEARASSGVQCHKEIERSCRQYGIELVHKVPAEPWSSEIAKRSFMFVQGEKITTEEDWFFVIDDDERVIETVEPRLLGDVAYALLVEPDGSQQPLRCFFRAQRGIQVVHNHFTYMCGTQMLWGGTDGNSGEEEFAYDSNVTLQHLAHKRPPARQQDKIAYYADRDTRRLEHLRCDWCSNYGPGRIPARWQIRNGLPFGYVVGVCPTCEADAVEEGRVAFGKLVGSPDVSAPTLI